MNSLKYANMDITPAVLYKLVIQKDIDLDPADIISLFNEGVASVVQGELSEYEAVDTMTRFILSSPKVVIENKAEDEVIKKTAAAAKSFANAAARPPKITATPEGLEVQTMSRAVKARRAKEHSNA